MQIINSSSTDIDNILKMFDDAIVYQRLKQYPLWPQFSKEMILAEIDEKRHWKLMENEEILCVFSVVYSDPVIWAGRENNDAVYLHRICTSKKHKGKNLIIRVRDWAIQHTKQKSRKFLRMDTWGSNENMRNYYVAHGFNYLGQSEVRQRENEAPMYCGSHVSLLQIEV